MTDYRPLIEEDVKELAKDVCSTGLNPSSLSYRLFINPNGSLEVKLSNINPALEGKSYMRNLLGQGYTGVCTVKAIRDGFQLRNEDTIFSLGYEDSKVETYGFEVTVTNNNFLATLPHPFIAPYPYGVFVEEGSAPLPKNPSYGANHYYFPKVIKTILNVEGIENFTKFELNT